MSVTRVALPSISHIVIPETWSCKVLLSASVDAVEYLGDLKSELASRANVIVEVQDKPWCTSKCTEWLQETREPSLSCTYHLHISKGATELALNDEMHGWLRLENKENIDKGVDLLAKTWFQQVVDDRVVAFSPLYLFSFFYVSDGKRRVSWDLYSDVEKPLSAILARLNIAFDFDLESQVVATGALTADPKSKVALSKIQSHFLQNANMWGTDISTDAMYRPAPILKFAAFSPSSEFSVVDDARNDVSSFFVQGWGAVSVLPTNGSNIHSALSGWVGHMRSRLLYLQADPIHDLIKLVEPVAWLNGNFFARCESFSPKCCRNHSRHSMD